MANMSYCRFQNTAQDLRDCYEYFTASNLSAEEKRARARIADLCMMILDECTDVEIDTHSKITITEYEEEEED